MPSSRCSEPRCKAQEDTSGSLSLIDGDPFCMEHYKARLEGEFLLKFQEWSFGSQPAHRFLYLLGRVSSEFQWRSIGDSYLTAARIRDRGFDFAKTETGCTFKIVRHPDAQQQGFVSKRVTESWKADIFAKELELIGAREFEGGDVERGMD